MYEHQYDRKGQVIDALRMSDEARALLLAELELGTVDPPSGSEKRKAQRLPYDAVGGLILHVTHRDGSNVRFLVKPRDISRTGIGVLHGAFVHPGTRCIVPLRDLSGQTTLAGGCIAYCRHIHGRIHELGIQFSKPIDLEQFVLDDRASLPEAATAIELPTLEGRALVVDEWNEDRQLLKHELRQLGLRPMLAAGGVVAWQRLGGQAARHNPLVRIGSEYAVVVAGEWLGDMSLAQLARAMRDHEVALPILGIVSEGADEAALLESGVNTVIHRPYRLEQLAQMLLRFLQMDKSDRQAGAVCSQKMLTEDETSESVLSERWVEPNMQPLILDFLQGFETRLGDVEHRIQHLHRRDDALRACLRLKSAAANFGLMQLGDAAGQLADLIATGASPKQINAFIVELHDQSALAFRTAKRYAAAA